MDAKQAEQARDTLAKQLYGKVFAKICDCINASANEEKESSHHIGLLDIAGFGEQHYENICIEPTTHFFLFLFRFNRFFVQLSDYFEC